jgi:hypothetical protein
MVSKFIPINQKIIDIYQKNKKNEKIKKIIDNEKTVLEKWSKILNINNINKDNFENILKFFDKEENQHWDHINRHKKDIKSNFRSFQRKIKNTFR